MRAFVAMVRKLVSLIVYDGTAALAALAWITLCGLLLRLVSESCWEGPILFVGLTLILIENTAWSAKARSG
jgi:hypothetical protein